MRISDLSSDVCSSDRIDQSFVRGAAIAGNRNAAIIKAIVTLAETLGMETTAEGVELKDELALIRELGCSHIQGYMAASGADDAAALAFRQFEQADNMTDRQEIGRAHA